MPAEGLNVIRSLNRWNAEPGETQPTPEGSLVLRDNGEAGSVGTRA